MELKKPHPSRLVGGTETHNRLIPHTDVVDKNSGGISWSEESRTHIPEGEGPGFSLRGESPNSTDAVGGALRVEAVTWD